jgi:hypothetical protein
MSSSFQMWSASPAAIAAWGDLRCQDVGSVKLTHYQSSEPRAGLCGPFLPAEAARKGKGLQGRATGDPSALRRVNREELPKRRTISRRSWVLRYRSTGT